MKPKSFPTTVGLTDNPFEDESIVLIDDFGLPSGNIHSTKWGISVEFIGEFEHLLEVSANMNDRA